ncbi:response regulator [Spirosoma sp. HMF4905]|uniref:Response regulator n=2 Tax=Spirosoma arboris TaxID=2682092 RepID=A0A7K1SPC3_9BACT|nr:response regulator [Spirosoma arboris]
MQMPSVWIVDDDEDDQLIICSAFQEESPPIKVLSLKDGEELLSRLAECGELPLLILLDINMPRKDGFEALRDLRSVAAYAELPVVMLTTSSEANDIQRCTSLGANYFLTKPLTYERLREMVQALRENWELI